MLASVATAQTTYELVHAFRNSCEIAGAPRPEAPDLASQSGLILASDGYLYGTSYWGGASGLGTIFRIDPSGGLTTVHSFAYADGANPAAALVEATDGNLYGTTTRGGQKGHGTVFRMDSSEPSRACTASTARKARTREPHSSRPATAISMALQRGEGGRDASRDPLQDRSDGTFKKLHDFHRYTDGAHPAGRLLQTTDGYLYGTTVEGGANNLGTVFRVDVATNSLVTIHTFDGSDGARPHAGLIQATDGNLYGTTSGEVDPYGNTRGGTVYKLDASGVLTTVNSGGQGRLTPSSSRRQTFSSTATTGAESGTVYQLRPLR